MQSPSKYMALSGLLEAKQNYYVTKTGIDLCPFETEALIVEKKNTLADSQLAAVKRWEKTFSNYEALGIGGMSPPPPKVIEQPKLQFIIQF